MSKGAIMATVTNVILVGGAYHRGRKCPGHGTVRLSNGVSMRIADSDAIGFEGCIVMAENAGHDATDFRRRIKEWVKTGKLPK